MATVDFTKPLFLSSSSSPPATLIETPYPFVPPSPFPQNFNRLLMVKGHNTLVFANDEGEFYWANDVTTYPSMYTIQNEPKRPCFVFTFPSGGNYRIVAPTLKEATTIFLSVYPGLSSFSVAA